MINESPRMSKLSPNMKDHDTGSLDLVQLGKSMKQMEEVNHTAIKIEAEEPGHKSLKQIVQTIIIPATRFLRRDSILKKDSLRNRLKERLNTQLLDAVRKADIENCERLINDGANPNATCRDTGATALIVSAAWNYDNVINILLKIGANPLISDEKGRTPAHVAAALGNEKALLALLEWEKSDSLINARLEEKTSNEFNKYFDSWVHQHKNLLPEIPKLEKGSTPLHTASQWSHSRCVKLLLDNGADALIRDDRGLTPLDVSGEVVYRPDNSKINSAHSKENLMNKLETLDEEFPSTTRKLTLRTLPELHDLSSEKESETVDSDKSSTRYIIEEIAAVSNRSKYVTYPIRGLDRKGSRRSSRRNKKSQRESAALGRIIGEEGGIKRTKNCLHTAVMKKDENLIVYLINSTFGYEYLFQLDEHGRTPAHIAVEMKDIDILSLLLEKIEIIDIPDNVGRTLLYLSAELEWIDGVDYLLNANADIKKTADDGSTVLHIAATKGSSELLEELFTFDDAVKVIDKADKYQKTPLWYAVDALSVQCVEYLLIHKANVRFANKITLFHKAAMRGSEEIMLLLLDSIHRVHDYDLFDGFSGDHGLTPLHITCMNGYVRCTALLIKWGANILNKSLNDKGPYFGSTPLHLAARNGRCEIAEMLLRVSDTKKALHVRNAVDWQPVHLAARFGRKKCARLLLKEGADLASVVTTDNGYKTTLDMIINYIPQPLEFLQDYIDSYITTNNYSLNNRKCIVTYNYDLFSSPYEEDRSQLTVLDAIVNSSKFQEILILHPVAETFIFLKWRKLRIFFFVMFIVYLLFTLFLTGMSLEASTDALPRFIKISQNNYRITIIILTVILTIHEILQIVQARRLESYYWTDWIEFESCIKLTTLVLAAFLVFTGNEKLIIFQNISSIAVLLSWIVSLMLFSRLFDWGFSVLMFFRVTKRVAKVLVTFTFLYLGFTFALMIEFRAETPFQNIWQSFTKVLVMTSELEFDNLLNKTAIKQDDSTEEVIWCLTSRSIMLLLVVLITISLMNLLVGLAVNDIKLLETKGRARRLSKQVSFLSLIEMFVYNSFLLSLFPGCIKSKIKESIKVPLQLHFATARPHLTNMDLFPKSVRNSMMEKINSLVNTEKKYALKDLNNKIDRLIRQQEFDKKQDISTEYTERRASATLPLVRKLTRRSKRKRISQALTEKIETL